MDHPRRWATAELDTKILEILGVEDGKSFKQICEILGICHTGFNDRPWREVDRCLQRLRKNNKIMFDAKGWILKTGKWERVN